jgi:shikimate dehydrogenase
MTRLFGLIGYPLSHSFSKKYFTEKFAREGITGCAYELFPLTSINELEDLLRANPQLQGLNVTIPYKQQVLPYLHSREGIPEGMGACNCIRISQGKLYGFNTDTIGCQKSFSPFLQPWHQKALVLGNGGAALAVVHVLKKLGIDYKVVSRQLHEGSALTYADLTPEIIQEHTVIINTTPLGTYPNIHECPPIPYDHITPKHFLYDLIYNPEKTLFLQKGSEHGAQIHNGYDMLVIQAEESWKIWSG